MVSHTAFFACAQARSRTHTSRESERESPFRDHNYSNMSVDCGIGKPPSIKKIYVLPTRCVGRSVGRSIEAAATTLQNIHTHTRTTYTFATFASRRPRTACCDVRFVVVVLLRCFNDSRTMVAGAPSSRDLLQAILCVLLTHSGRLSVRRRGDGMCVCALCK